MTEDLYTLGPSLLGPLSKRPSPAQEIRQFIDKDTGTTYISNGTAWLQFLPGVTSDDADGIVVAGDAFLNGPDGAFVQAHLQSGSSSTGDATSQSLIVSNSAVLGGLETALYNRNYNSTDGPFSSLDLTPGVDAYIAFRVPAPSQAGQFDLLELFALLDSSVTADDAARLSIAMFAMADTSGSPDATSIYALYLRSPGPSLRVGVTLSVAGVHRNAVVGQPYWIGVKVDGSSINHSYPAGLLFPDSLGNETPIPAHVSYAWPTFAFARTAKPQLNVTTMVSALRSPYHGANAVEGYDFAFAQVPALICTDRGVGEFGVTPPATRPAITGNVTTGSLANLQTVVGQLLTALDAKGSITKSTT